MHLIYKILLFSNKGYLISLVSLVLCLKSFFCPNDVVKINNFRFFDVCYENQFKYL
ncbi:uncharacterized protein BX663DRAFT_308373 [Cokeromyces recurvatus]|uniref:uncharacterized protein n=1 Tax=Cokeromyces recurvatus TaxID=90255 RepID=UPI00221F03C7|nr:uncharacterized protein BX663DRAFT_308373 [Cokeromyces recurvatus]KAI7905029.1 hypothetical protein BX663DRAFT_308373 [Cokeromyces recurvatus]